ncbi:MAG: competence/damage-inducible protein A [Alphaproteobacteria bacterium]
MTDPTNARDTDGEITAAVLVIGDEILSGRTQDTNSGYIAKVLTSLGVRLREVRVVGDVADEIVTAVNALRRAYTYVFTTGGIGPTHDDITADAVAAAFDLPISENRAALEMLARRFGTTPLGPARRRMARVPHGAQLIENQVSDAPGFQVENVFVLAGVPKIMRAMMDALQSRLKTGKRLLEATIATDIREGDVAFALGEVQKAHAGVAIGSYPFFTEQGAGTNIVARAVELSDLQAAAKAVIKAVEAAGGSAHIVAASQNKEGQD